MDGTTPVYIETPPMRDALAMMHEVYRDPKGLGTLRGLTGSGRRTVLEQFASRLRREDVSAVVVDGNGMDRLALLRTVLSEIGYELDTVAPDDLSSMLRVFLIHQCHAGQPVFLGFVNVSGMHPSALEEICRLVQITAANEAAARLVLSCDDRLEQIIQAPAMVPVRERITAGCRLRPLDLIETDDYIVRHLRAAGAGSHTEYLTDGAIALLWRASGGLPGEIESLTRDVLLGGRLPADTEEVRAALGIDERPAEPAAPARPADATRPEPPTRLVVSRDGKIVNDRHWPAGRVLIGRDAYNDVTLTSRYVSRHHALIVVEDGRAWIADLKSMNGTYVNSRRVSQKALQHDDVISIGNHRVKYLNPAARHGDVTEEPGLADTAIMRSLQEVRHLFAVDEAGDDTVLQHAGEPGAAGDKAG
ncbi:FHA domain-containing protein [Lentisalinibacter salinarum]|uniref:FHA domain-containing protein n=1 Tax=Lentisalinibacter salinarum TaxID=2992239 RepID=UPI00386F915D